MRIMVAAWVWLFSAAIAFVIWYPLLLYVYRFWTSQ